METKFAELTGGDVEGAIAVLGDGRSEADPDGAPFEGIVILEARGSGDAERRILLRKKRGADLDGLLARLDVETDGGRLILRLGL